jgi:hypothetical protein
MRPTAKITWRNTVFSPDELVAKDFRLIQSSRRGFFVIGIVRFGQQAPKPISGAGESPTCGGIGPNLYFGASQVAKQTEAATDTLALNGA